MLIDFLPASRSSIRLPTNSAPPSLQQGGFVVRRFLVEAHSVCDHVAHVTCRPHHAGGHFGTATDCRQGGRQELAQKIELRRQFARGTRGTLSAGAVQTALDAVG